MDAGHDIETPAGQTPESVRTNEDLTQAAAAGLRWVTYARVSIEVVLFGALVLLARLIPPSAFGVFALVVIVQELAVLMPMDGIGGAIVNRKSISKQHLQAGLAATTILSLLLAGITVAIALLVVGPLIGHQAQTFLILTTPYFLLGAIYAIPMAILRRRLDFRRLSIVDLSLNATRALATLALALFGLDAGALVFGSMAGMAAALCLALFFAPIPPPRWNTQAVRDLIPYGGPASLATVAWTGFRNGDYAIIGGVLGTAQAGFYWRSYQLAVEYQGKIATMMGQVAFPVLSRTEGTEELLEMRQRMVRLLTVTVFPFLAFLFILAPVVIPWLFGERWEPAVVPTQILVLGGAATLLINACGSALQGAGRAQALLGYGIAHFIAYVGAVLVVAHLGIEAVAIAGSVVHGIFLVVAYFILLHDRLGAALRVLWQDLAPATTACLALMLAGGGIDLGLAGLEAPVLAHIAAVCLFGGIAYLLVLRLWFPDSAHDLAAAVRRIVPQRLAVGRIGRAVLAEP